jgi:guanylate kinase
MSKGPLIIVSGASGSGKSTVIAQVLARGGLPLRLSVSATTRACRGKEVDGVHYHFWDRDRFLREVEAGGFIEWAEVHGRLYGTLRSEVDPYRERGTGVILDIDVQGAEQVRRCCPDHVSVFLRTSSVEVLERRLRMRGTETEEATLLRLANARRELERAGEYQYQVINDDLEPAVARLTEIIRDAFGRR